jgi:FKBP-type peptidyl-prolyl cis-trans isomerase SlyD
MIKKNDFIQIEYTGKTKEEGIIFDTTDEKLAKEQGFLQENATYGPVVICVGQNQVISGLDKYLEDKEAGKEYDITLQPEEAFGKKSAELIQLIPSRKFKESEVQPQPGLQVNIDGLTGIIKTVSGGRVLVDFNHPLSGKEIEYKIKILKKVEDDKEKLEGLLKIVLGTKDIKVELKESKASIELKADLPKEAQDHVKEKVKELISSVKEIVFKKEENKKEPTKQ